MVSQVGDVKENSFGGFDLSDNELFEVSLVAVPAHQAALRKSLAGKLSKRDIEKLCTVNGCSFSKSLADDKRERTEIKTTKKEFKMKTLAERIKSLQTEINATKDTIKSIAENEEATEEQNEVMLAATGTVQELEKKLDGLMAAEKAIATQVKETKKPVVTEVKTVRAKGDLVTKLFVSIAKAHVDGTSVSVAAEKTYGSDKEAVKFTKAATIPADTTTTGWAAELVEQGYGEFLDLLYPETIYGRVGAKMLYFGKYGSLIIPSWKSSDKLAGSFILEGSPIPVKAGEFQSKTLTPKKMGVITTFTREILTKSTPAIEQLVRTAIVNDTANAIDSAFMDNAAGTAVRPAGLQNPAATGAANIVASTGSTVTDILADVKGVFGRLTAVQLGRSGQWVMNPMTVLGLATKQIGTGQFAFAEVNSGTFAGHPIVSSTNVPTGIVMFIDSMALAKASDIAPEFTVSNSATLVMGDPASAVSGATDPVRSLYQTDTVGLRFILGLDWSIQRAAGVQILTGVAY